MTATVTVPLNPPSPRSRCFQAKGGFTHFFHSEDLLLIRTTAAVEIVGPVVLLQLDLSPAEGKGSVFDAVGIPTDDAPEKGSFRKEVFYGLVA